MLSNDQQSLLLLFVYLVLSITPPAPLPVQPLVLQGQDGEEGHGLKGQSLLTNNPVLCEDAFCVLHVQTLAPPHMGDLGRVVLKTHSPFSLAAAL